MDLFSPVTKDSDSLPGNWSYDSAIDLFSLDPAGMDPNSFEFADSLTSANSKDLFMDPFGTPTAISGFTMSTADDTVSLSSDLDSDDQSWSVGARPSPDLVMSSPRTTRQSSKPTTRASLTQSTSTTTSSTRWSSSPEIKPQDNLAPRPDKRTPSTSTRKARSLSDDFNTDSTTRSGSTQDTQGRNAAKRAAHNIIEKRYRTNMNAKFLALEKATSPAAGHKTGRAGAGSLKKSEILSNALAYIESVQLENQAMRKELALLTGGKLSGGAWGRAKQGRS
ncbi:uncharacterized protein N7482_009168 [Penicillium canariense]|uniref:BHLH domain-containing protein n=1 Tax=Penicillium canariense TaxID=189055 RepID=A0A9W9LG09_9EURO|nr:uncharacterized protein N7482_009168 [Penicillium canariense]KAJ5152690.1 hypothetical protein N7482_009168 [Penicillium canariense]